MTIKLADQKIKEARQRIVPLTTSWRSSGGSRTRRP